MDEPVCVCFFGCHHQQGGVGVFQPDHGSGGWRGAIAVDTGGNVSILTDADANKSVVIEGSANKFIVDGKVGIGTAVPSEQLSISGGNLFQRAGVAPTAVGSASVGNSVTAMSASGRYAYVGNLNVVGGNDFSVFDVTNPAAPTLVGGIDVGVHVNTLFIAGNYAFVGTSNSGTTCIGATASGCEFRIYNISSISGVNPISAVGGVEIGSPVNGIFVSGTYAYVVSTSAGTCSFSDQTGCGFRMYDIGNPAEPKFMGGIGLGSGQGGYSVHVSGTRAYVGTSSYFMVFDISDPANLPPPFSVLIGGTVNAVHVSGNRAYIGASTNSGGEFRVYNITPSTPSLFGEVDIAPNGASSLAVAGKYAYVGAYAGGGSCNSLDISGCELRVYDVSSGSPTNVAGLNLTDSIGAVAVAGKYAYLGTGNAAGNNFFVADISGLDAPVANIGSLLTSFLSVSDNARIDNTLSSGALTVGKRGILSQGPISGNFVFKRGSVSVVNGVNNHDLDIGDANYIVLSGATSAFTITGIAGGYDGRIIILRNSTGVAMTLQGSSSSSLAGNQILDDGVNATSGSGTATLIYDGALAKWVIVSMAV